MKVDGTGIGQVFTENVAKDPIKPDLDYSNGRGDLLFFIKNGNELWIEGRINGAHIDQKLIEF